MHHSSSQIRYKEKKINGGSGEAQEQVAKRCYRCPIAKNIQSQVGQGFEQPDVVEDAHCKGVGLNEI